MNSRLFLLFLFLGITCIVNSQLPTPSKGSINRFENFPSRYVDPRNIDVWLPEDFNINKKYGVLYMHDGQMLFDASITWNKQEWRVDETLSALFNKRSVREVIVVGIWNNGKLRHAEYFPAKPLQTFSKDQRKTLLPTIEEPLADEYLKFIVKELKPFIDSIYPTKKDKRNSFIAGSSMGGLISLYAICEYPEVFYGAACLSTHWPGNFKANDEIPNAFNDYLKNNLPSPKDHRIWFDHGTAGLDSLYSPYQQMVDLSMQKKGFSKMNWITRVFVGEDHSEDAWSKRLTLPFEFILDKKKK
jgi:predicted alpha/beta superfamily hydrolase